MENSGKTKKQLVEELRTLRLSLAEVEKLETERRQVEKALRESEEKYRTLVEDALIGIVNVDIKGKITYVNKAILQGTGYSLEDLLGKNAFSSGLIHSGSLKLLRKRLKEKLMGEPPSPVEIQFKCKDGKWIWLQIAGKALWKHGMPVGVQIIGENITERKRAEEAVRESEEKYRSLVSNVKLGVFRSTLERAGRFLEVNPAMEKITGYRRKELLQMNVTDLYVHPEERERVLEEIASGKEKVAREVQFKKKDGTEIVVLDRKVAVRDDAGNILYFDGILEDITERKQAEEALKESEERYRSVIQSAHDMIQSVEPDGKFIFVNPAWLQTLGYTEAELPGLNLFNIIHPESLAHCQELFAKVMRGESVRNIQTTFIAKDGREIVVEGDAAARYVGSNIVATQGVFRDITERKQAEARIVHLTNVLQALRGINQLIAHEKDKERLIQQSCNIMVETRGYTVAWMLLLDEYGNYISAVGAGAEKSFPILLEQMKRGEYPPCVREILAQEPPFTACDDVKKQHIECGLADCYMGGGVGFVDQLEYEGRVYGIVCVAVSPEMAQDEEEHELFRELATDVSSALARIEREEEHGRTEEKLREAKAFKELDRLRSELMANISHELRTPLASIKGFASTLLQPDVKWSEEEQRDFLQSIDQEADRLTRLISDLLDMSRLEAGALKLEKRDYRVSEILGSVGYRLASLTEHHQLEVIVPAELPAVFVDEMRIGQVLTNMVENATKFSSKDSPITIEAQLAEDQVIISVTDRGQGIPPELLDRVFDRFYQTESIVTGRKSGTGLGLSICQGIIKAHGGRIWVESEVGEGSKFSFSLPVSQSEEQDG